jgi:hypothetical protein
MMSHSERITFLIYCTEPITPMTDYRLQVLVGNLWYARMWKARILIPDDYTSILVARECDRHRIPVRCFGTNKRARNGVNPYTRVIGGIGERDQLMVMEADTCFFWGEKTKPLSALAQGLGKQVYELC